MKSEPETEKTTRKDLVVCHCFNIHESAIAKTIRTGARNVTAVSGKCGAGARAGCGGCHVSIERIIRGATVRKVARLRFRIPRAH